MLFRSDRDAETREKGVPSPQAKQNRAVRSCSSSTELTLPREENFCAMAEAGILGHRRRQRVETKMKANDLPRHHGDGGGGRETSQALRSH